MPDLSRGFRLGEWVVRPEDGSLKSPDAAVRLEPQLMELLVFLASRAGRVVPRQDVLDRVWGGRFVSDDTIKAAFYQLRKTLGDDPRQPRFIETLPKRGYRMLIEPVPLDAGPYEKGRAALAGDASPASLKQALLYFERALQSDPGCAAAFAALARTYIMMASAGVAPGAELWVKARAAALRAVELDAKLAEAHLCLAVIRFAADHDHGGAASEFALAIELDPNDALTRRWHARFLSARARHVDAIREAREAMEIDPLSLSARRDFLEVLFMARRYEEVVAEAEKLFEIAPAAADVRLGLVWVQYLRGEHRQAFESFIAALKVLDTAESEIERARSAFARGGMREIFRIWAAMLEQQSALGQKTQNDLIGLYALIGENDSCFALIDAALASGNPFLAWLPVSPLFDGLRGDPRYAQVLSRDVNP